MAKLKKVIKTTKGKKIVNTVKKVEVATVDKPLVDVKFTNDIFNSGGREYSVLDVKVVEDASIEKMRKTIKHANVQLNKAVAEAVNKKLAGVVIDNDGVVVKCHSKENMFNIIIDVDESDDKLVTYVNLDDHADEREALNMFNISK